MKNFLKGVMFSYLLIPLFEGIDSIINQAAEYFSLKIASKTYILKKSITDLENDDDDDKDKDKESISAIGFEIPNYSYNEEEEE